MNPIKIAILGSSGSIGTQTLEVVRLHKEFKVLGISGNRNIEEIFTQCKEFHPQLAVMMNNEAAEELKALLHKEELHEIQVLSGMDGLMALAVMEEVQILVTAIVGMIGLRPTIAAIKCKKTIALANKETLVTAGELIMPLAKKMGVKIIPVDSEHSAIYQSIANVPYDRIEKVILTASGGPFRGKKAEDLKKVSREEALRHPNWAMGAKITIDSSTLMNKGLEVIEAKWLFDLEPDQIDVVVHPQSIIHSMVQFIDGSVIGQMGLPDMKLPIQYALFDGKREYMPYERLDLTKISTLTFEKPDPKTFICLELAFEALRYGKEIPTVLNAANEKAVELFLHDQIHYYDISYIVKETMCSYIKEKYDVNKELSLELILETESWAYGFIESRWKK